MNYDIESKIIHMSRQILYTYFTENRLDYLFSRIADDIVFVGMGKYLKAEGRDAVCHLFKIGQEKMFPCIMSEETYIARPLGDEYWFCEAQTDLETQPGLPLFFHECQRTTFIYRRNAEALSGLGWEMIHLNNSLAWKQIRPQELFAWSTGMKNYDLLQKQEETDLTPPDMAILYDLIEHSVYDAMPPDTQELLQLLSIFDTFTAEQAEHMWRRGTAATLLATEVPHNSFLTFEAVHSQYRFHHTLAGFLRKQATRQDKTWQKSQHQHAATWYLKAKQYNKALEMAYTVSDYETLLTAIERGGPDTICRHPFPERSQYFEKAPREIQQRHILAGIIIALDSYIHENQSPLYAAQAQQLKGLLHRLKSGIPDASLAEGYLEILKGLTSFNDLAHVSPPLQKACLLLPQGAPALGVGSCLTMGSPSLLYLYHRKEGSLKKEIRQLQDLADTVISHLDQHDSSGMGDMAEAEYLYFLGHLEKAEIKAFKVQEMARRSCNITNRLCASFLQAWIGLIRGNWSRMSYFIDEAKDYVKGDSQPLHQQTWMLGTSYIYSVMGMPQGIARDISEDRLPEGLYPPLEPYFYVILEKSLLLRGEYHKLAGLFPMHYEAASRLPNVLAQIYLSLFAAVAYLKLFHKEEGMNLLRQALNLAQADGLVIPFAENMQYIAIPLQQLLHAGFEVDFIKRIQTLSLEEKIQSLQQQIDEKEHGYSLTSREKEILQLIMTGLSNRNIAEKLNIAEVTVKKTLGHLYKKTGTKTRTSLIHYFSQRHEF